MRNLNVRMSDELHARLKAAADGDIRSLNGEIIVLLEEALDKRAERERIARWLEVKAAEGGIPVTLRTAAAIIRNGLPPQEDCPDHEGDDT